MADVLDQDDVDALLAAVGGAEEAEEVEDLFGGGDSDASEKKEVTVYDFKRPERVSKDQMRALEGMHEAFARNFGASLSAFMRTIVEVKIADTEQLTYNEFINSLPNPTCINVLSIRPWEGSVCLEISPLIIFPFIDRLLGGADINSVIPQRPLTVIEQRLVNRIIERALTLLNDTWSSLGVEELELSETESNPHLIQMVAPNEVVVVITFEIRFSGKSGTMSLCIPFATIEPVLEKLATQSWLSYRKKEHDLNYGRRVAKNLSGAKVNIRAFLAETSISMGQIMELKEGDIIQTEKPANSEVIIQVEGKNKFAGRIGKFRGNRAIRITRFASPDERL